MRPRALLLATAIAATAFGGAAAEPLDRAGFTLAAEPAAAGSQAEFVLRGVVATTLQAYLRYHHWAWLCASWL